MTCQGTSENTSLALGSQFRAPFDGPIDHDHYRNKARELRADAMRAGWHRCVGWFKSLAKPGVVPSDGAVMRRSLPMNLLNLSRQPREEARR